MASPATWDHGEVIARAASQGHESMAINQQGSVLMSMAHITTRGHWDVPVRVVTGDHMDVQGLCRKGLTLTGCDDLESWSHFLPGQYLGEQALHLVQVAQCSWLWW